MAALPTKSPFQQIKTSKTNIDSNTSSQPKSSNLRETCKNFFIEALKETADYPEEKYREIATILEYEIFSIEKIETTPKYRAQVNGVKARLKGVRNSATRLLLLQNQVTPSSFINNPNVISELPNQNTNLNLSNIQPPLLNFVKTETHSNSVILPKQINVPAALTIPAKVTQKYNQPSNAPANNRPIPPAVQKQSEKQAQTLHEEKKYPIKQVIQEKNETKSIQPPIQQTIKQEDDSEEKKFEIDYENDNNQIDNNEVGLDFENENNHKFDFDGNESPEKEEERQEDEEEETPQNNMDLNSVEKKLSEFNKLREELKNSPDEEEFEAQKYPDNEGDQNYEEEENEKQQELNYFHSQNEEVYYHDQRQEEDQLEYNEENNDNNNIDNNINIEANQYAFEGNQNENNDQENIENEEININPEERFDLMGEEITETRPLNHNEEKNEEEQLVNQLNEEEKIEGVEQVEPQSESENIYFIKAVQLEIQLAAEKQRNIYLDDEVKALRSLNKKNNEAIKNLECSSKNNNSEETHKKYIIKEKENEMLKHELQITQKELKIMKDHLNKMIEENSKFKNEIEEFKRYSDEEKFILRQEIENLHSRITEDLEPSIQKYKNENYLIEQKLNITHQKVELLTKDNQEKDNRIRQLLNLNSDQNQESSLFSNLTAELQKQTLSLQKLVTEREIARSHYKNKSPDSYYKEKLTNFSKEIDRMANDKFSEGSKASEKKTNALPETRVEHKIETKIEKRIGAIEEIEKEIIVQPHIFDKREIPQTNEGSKEPELINIDITQTPSELNQKPEANQEEEKTIDNSEVTVSPVIISSPPPPPLPTHAPLPPPPPKKMDNPQKIIIPQNNNFMHPKLHRPANKLAPPENKSPNVFKPFQMVPPPPPPVTNPENDAEDFFTKLGHESATLEERKDERDIKTSDLFRDESTNKLQTEFPNITPTTKPQTFEPKIDSFHANIEATKSQSNISTHQPSQSLNLKNRREEIRKNVEVQKPTLTKNNPNMESTTSIHSMQSNLTETEIKRGGGVRKGIIPNSLFD